MVAVPDHVFKVLLGRSCVQMSWITAPAVSTKVVYLRSFWISLKELSEPYCPRTVVRSQARRHLASKANSRQARQSLHEPRNTGSPRQAPIP
jgi:hypothetical protein